MRAAGTGGHLWGQSRGQSRGQSSPGPARLSFPPLPSRPRAPLPRTRTRQAPPIPPRPTPPGVRGDVTSRAPRGRAKMAAGGRWLRSCCSVLRYRGRGRGEKAQGEEKRCPAPRSPPAGCGLKSTTRKKKENRPVVFIKLILEQQKKDAHCSVLLFLHSSVSVIGPGPGAFAELGL